MNQDEVRKRLKEELKIPAFSGNLPDKEFTEEEYQKLKQDLLQYFEKPLPNYRQGLFISVGPDKKTYI